MCFRDLGFWYFPFSRSFYLWLPVALLHIRTETIFWLFPVASHLFKAATRIFLDSTIRAIYTHLTCIVQLFLCLSCLSSLLDLQWPWRRMMSADSFSPWTSRWWIPCLSLHLQRLWNSPLLAVDRASLKLSMLSHKSWGQKQAVQQIICILLLPSSSIQRTSVPLEPLHNTIFFRSVCSSLSLLLLTSYIIHLSDTATAFAAFPSAKVAEHISFFLQWSEKCGVSSLSMSRTCATFFWQWVCGTC